MTSVRLLTVVLLAAAAPTARGAEPFAPAAGQLLGSCSVGDMSCTDFEKAVGPGAKDACVKYKLTWSPLACSDKKVVGTCAKSEGGGRSFTHSYAPATAEVAKKACVNTPGGVFVPRA
jgi:hypothetical protein